jgi:putative tryptophan/tyrosine transport system substrate-binding protein
MQRRKFLAVLGGVAAVPLATRAQQTDVRRIGMLVNTGADTSDVQARLAAFRLELHKLGWTEGSNVHFDFRTAEGNSGKLRKYASELIALGPDVVLAVSSPSVAALQRTSRSVPIVFVTVVDPVGSGFVESLGRPGDTTTGLATFEYSLSSKWVELLREIAPTVTRAAVLRDPGNPSGIGQFAALQVAAPSLGVDLRPIDVRDTGGMERLLAIFAQSASGGMIVTSAGSAARRDLIIMLAAKYRLPTVYPFRSFISAGGLISYGPDLVDQYRRAAGHVDRILKGERPADLPVQAPTKYELVINLKTAKALGLDVPPQLLARADEVIE